MESFIDFFTFKNPSTVYVVAGTMLIGAISAVVGCFSFLRKRALVGDAVAHSVLPGVCLAFLLFNTKNLWVLLGGAFASGWLSLIVIDIISRKTRIKPDTAIALTLSVFFGIGILLLTAIQKSGNAAQSGLDHFLFGKAAAIVWDDLVVFAILGLTLFIVVILLFKEFKLLSFDMSFARSVGLPTRLLEVALSTITVLAVTVGIQTVGVVLVVALLITPAVAARYWTDRLTLMIFLAATFAALSGVAGSYISYNYKNMPLGPWIIVVLSAIAGISILLAPKRGVLAKALLKRANRGKILKENILKLFYHLGEKEQNFFKFYSIDKLQARRSIPERELLTGLKKLKNRQLAEVGASGWRLTKAGLERGKRLTKIHRLWELYLTEYLQIAPDHVHDDAEAIEHVITPELEAELEKLLNYPQTDPHSQQIPYEK